MVQISNVLFHELCLLYVFTVLTLCVNKIWTVHNAYTYNVHILSSIFVECNSRCAALLINADNIEIQTILQNREDVYLLLSSSHGVIKIYSHFFSSLSFFSLFVLYANYELMIWHSKHFCIYSYAIIVSGIYCLECNK